MRVFSGGLPESSLKVSSFLSLNSELICNKKSTRILLGRHPERIPMDFSFEIKWNPTVEEEEKEASREVSDVVLIRI